MFLPFRVLWQKGHQAMHFVSSTPSKIPYGGFSPVRLQTHFTPRPPSHVLLHLLIGRHCRLLHPRLRIRTCVQAAPGISNPLRGSSSSWLPIRFYCPAGSLLTMAKSAPLMVAQWFILNSAVGTTFVLLHLDQTLARKKLNLSTLPVLLVQENRDCRWQGRAWLQYARKLFTR